VPVRIERTGLRTIAVGAGDSSSLALPYLPANADIHSGDLLVTSGLGGVFPEGYPVARVTEVHRDAIQPLAQVRAAPLAHLDTDTEVMLVWFRADHPSAPASPASTTGELARGNALMQPQTAPTKPQPLLPAPRPAPTAGAAAAAKEVTAPRARTDAAAAKPPAAPRAAESPAAAAPAAESPVAAPGATPGDENVTPADQVPTEAQTPDKAQP
jgi:hypothetical protein